MAQSQSETQGPLFGHLKVTQGFHRAFPIEGISHQGRNFDDIGILVEQRVGRILETAARETGFGFEALRFIGKNYPCRAAFAALHVVDAALGKAVEGLEIAVKTADFDAQTAGPLRKQFPAKCAAVHLVTPLAQSRQVVVADNARAVEDAGGKVETLEKRDSYSNAATGKVVYQMAECAERSMPDIYFRGPDVYLHQVTRQIHLRCGVAQCAGAQGFLLEAGTRDVNLCAAAERAALHFATQCALQREIGKIRARRAVTVGESALKRL